MASGDATDARDSQQVAAGVFPGFVRPGCVKRHSHRSRAHGAEAVWQRIVETERALRGVIREVYAARFGEAAARRIEEALPERESIVDYLYLGQLPPLLFGGTLGRMLVTVWAARRT